MIDQYWHTSGLHGIFVRAALRTFQFVFAVIIAGLYGIDLASGTRAHAKADSEWIYAEVVAGLSVLTCAVHCSVTVIHVAWCVWDGILFLLWLVLVAVFYPLAFTGKGILSGDPFSIQNLRASVWFGLLSMLLWLTTAAEGGLWCSATRKFVRQMPNLDAGDEMVDGKILDEEEQDHQQV